MQALIDACAQPDFPAQVSVVISNKPQAAGLQKAAEAGIQTAIVDDGIYKKKVEFEAQLQNVLSQHPVDFICLAGFMKVISADFISKWPDQIINIHPSLLPAYKGLNVHERVLEDQCEESGCTVHFVVPEVDSGPIIVQKKVPVLRDDTPDTLAARILEQEHTAFPEAIKILAGK